LVSFREGGSGIFHVLIGRSRTVVLLLGILVCLLPQQVHAQCPATSQTIGSVTWTPNWCDEFNGPPTAQPIPRSGLTIPATAASAITNLKPTVHLHRILLRAAQLHPMHLLTGVAIWPSRSSARQTATVLQSAPVLLPG
jgi:hypothetical protein